MEKPWSSTWRYTSAAVGLSLLASLVSIFLIWFTTTPFFDIRKFFALAWQQMVIFRASLMLGLIGLVIVWGGRRNTSTTITCALLIKLITGSYMTALLTSALSRFIVEHFEWGAWTDALPWASIYPSIALPFTVFLWGGTWWAVLYLRKHVKAQAVPAGREHVDVYDKLGGWFQRRIEKRARLAATVR